MKNSLLGALLFAGLLVAGRVEAAESWAEALARMPLGTNVSMLDRSNCVAIMLPALRSNSVVKALIFMPGATDEFYMFRRARANLAMPSATLLDAVSALTNQTLIRATFRAPLLLLHSDEDPMNLIIEVNDQPTADRIGRLRFENHVVFDDRDWDYIQPHLRDAIRTDLRPWSKFNEDSWHFYRHSFAAWGLTAREALEATAWAGKTRITIDRKRVTFELDERVRATPKFDTFPK